MNMKFHVDDDWISEKIDGHGGAYFCRSYNGLATISFIGGASGARVMWYNFVLFFKYVGRLIEKRRI